MSNGNGSADSKVNFAVVQHSPMKWTRKEPDEPIRSHAIATAPHHLTFAKHILASMQDGPVDWQDPLILPANPASVHGTVYVPDIPLSSNQNIPRPCHRQVEKLKLIRQEIRDRANHRYCHFTSSTSFQTQTYRRNIQYFPPIDPETQYDQNRTAVGDFGSIKYTTFVDFHPTTQTETRI
jgi:hypothetical protein